MVQVPSPCLISEPFVVTVPVTAWLSSCEPLPSRVRAVAVEAPRFRLPLIVPPVNRVTWFGKLPRLTLPLIRPALVRVNDPPALDTPAEEPLIVPELVSEPPALKTTPLSVSPVVVAPTWLVTV